MGGLPNELIPDPHVPQTEESQIVDHRWSTSSGVVERPGADRHCGDDLVCKGILSPGIVSVPRWSPMQPLTIFWHFKVNLLFIDSSTVNIPLGFH